MHDPETREDARRHARGHFHHGFVAAGFPTPIFAKLPSGVTEVRLSFGSRPVSGDDLQVTSLFFVFFLERLLGLAVQLVDHFLKNFFKIGAGRLASFGEMKKQDLQIAAQKFYRLGMS